MPNVPYNGHSHKKIKLYIFDKNLEESYINEKFYCLHLVIATFLR